MQYSKFGIFALLLQSTVLMAQECDHTHRWWLNLGIGVGNANAYGSYPNNLNGEAASQLSFNGMITENLFMSLGWTGIYNNDHYWENDSEVREIGLLLGYKSKRPNWYWSAATGVGASHYEIQYRVYPNNFYSSYKITESTTNFAVPVEGQLFWTPFKHFGIGVIGHASVSKTPFATAMIALQFA